MCAGAWHLSNDYLHVIHGQYASSKCMHCWLHSGRTHRQMHNKHTIDIIVIISLFTRQRTSMTSWWALDTSVRLLWWLNTSEMSLPNVYPAPRGEMPHPARSSGSDHSRSHMGPSCGTWAKGIIWYCIVAMSNVTKLKMNSETNAHTCVKRGMKAQRCL